MKTKIIPVSNPALREYIQYFLFFEHTGLHHFSYSTFPNTNLCLAIYRQNRITYLDKGGDNTCTVSTGAGGFSSRLIGFHDRPFKVDIAAPLDQVCILFQPAGLKAFTKVPYKELCGDEQVFETLFADRHIQEQLFGARSPEARAMLLEAFLLKQLGADRVDRRLMAGVKHILSLNGSISVGALCDQFGVDASTLYRHFTTQVGQSPKEFLQTVRFRNALAGIINGRYRHLSELACHIDFFDQSHFIRDFKKRSGQVPRTLQGSIQVVQNELAWLPAGDEPARFLQS